jgi:anti-sigma factor (TIGR02949 family)
MKISESCAETFKRLDDYVDRELTPEEAQEVARHLERCARCADEFAVESDLLEMLKEKLRHIAAPPGLMDRIRRRLEDEG